VRYGVVGDPVAHSRSPAIHNAAFAHLAIDAEYVPIHTPFDAFDDVIGALRTGALAGVNVTMPHKQHAFDAVDLRTDRVERVGAVNTIVVDGRFLVGYNTDVAGVTHAVATLGLPPTTPVLVLGTGGAARAAVVALEGRPLSVSGRDDRKAIGVLTRAAVTADVVPWGTGVPGAIIVNATPIGMDGGELPDGIVDEACGLLDMVYGSGPTPAVLAARDAGIPFADGIDMLVGQAAEAFERFTGRPAPIGVMRAAARR
jgi:shikimate dehydrogenase